jgi:predicted phosphodiesterase
MTQIRVALLSDIHGMLPSLDQALDEILTDPPDEIIVAGDFVGGPQSHEVIARLRALNAHFILGNGEVRILQMYNRDAPEAWWTHRQYDLTKWVFQHLTEDDFQFIASLPEQRSLQFGDADPIRVVHGTPWSVVQLMYPDEDPDLLAEALAFIDEKILVLGHIHQPGIYYMDGKLAVNPGALANNLNGKPQVSYATLTWEGDQWQPEIHVLAPDYEAIHACFVGTGFWEAAYPFSRAILESIHTGEDVPLAFLRAAAEHVRAAGLDEFDVVPDELWLAVGSNFPWKMDFNLEGNLG